MGYREAKEVHVTLHVSIARKAASDWLKKTVEENKEWNRKRVAQETMESKTLWKSRGPELIAQIDGYIKRASAQGKHGILEPSDLNPHGDPIIWLSESDQPIHKLLMAHYRKQGFTVVEYTPLGLKITW